MALGADALIVADTAVMAYCRDHHPQLRLHLSVQASATSYEAIEFYRQRYGIQRAVLPRVLTLAQVGHVIRHTPVDIEVFGFGSLCVMVEGRCALSSYATGQSPNNAGVCSPPSAVRWQDTDAGVEARLNGVLIDRYAPDEPRGYPTLCKGRFDVDGQRDYAIEEPTSLNTLALLPELIETRRQGDQDRGPPAQPGLRRAGHRASGARRSTRPARPTRRYSVQPGWTATLARFAEGQQHTLGAYNRPGDEHMSSTMPSSAWRRLALTVGPVLYHWPRQALMDFYAAVADIAGRHASCSARPSARAAAS